MADLERLTVTLPSDMVAAVKSAVTAGDYASESELVREAINEWKTKRIVQAQEFEALKADIAKGLADAAAGRTKDFDAESIIDRGRKLLANRSDSA